MKKDKIDLNFDDIIGVESTTAFSKSEHDKIRAYRRNLFANRTAQERLDDILTGFRFNVNDYAEQENPKEIIHLGQFFSALLSQINIKKGRFAEYIEISARNINKYFSGERKFNIDHALKLEKLFNINAQKFLEIQIKNELLSAKNAKKGKYDKYNLDDLLSD